VVSYKGKYRKYFLGKFNILSEFVIRDTAVCGKVQINAVFWWGNLRDRDNSEDPDVDGKIILRWIFRKWDRGVNCIAPTQKRDR
jgi:hypothetical protein